RQRGATHRLPLLTCQREAGGAWVIPPPSPHQSDERPTLRLRCSLPRTATVMHVAAEDQVHRAALYRSLLEPRERAPAVHGGFDRAARCRRLPLDVWQGKGNYMPKERPSCRGWRGCQGGDQGPQSDPLEAPG